MVISNNTKNVRYIACLLAVFIAVMSCYVKPVKANVAVVGGLTVAGLEALFNLMGIAGIEFGFTSGSSALDDDLFINGSALDELNEKYLSKVDDDYINRLNNMGENKDETGKMVFSPSDLIDTVSYFTDSVAVSSITPTWLASSSAGSYTSSYFASYNGYNHTYDFNYTFDDDVFLYTMGFLSDSGQAIWNGNCLFMVGILDPDYVDCNYTYTYYLDGSLRSQWTKAISSNSSNVVKYVDDCSLPYCYFGTLSYTCLDDENDEVYTVPSSSDFDAFFTDYTSFDDVIDYVESFIDSNLTSGYDLFGGVGVKVGSILSDIASGATSVADSVADWLADICAISVADVDAAEFEVTPNITIEEDAENPGQYTVVQTSADAAVAVSTASTSAEEDAATSEDDNLDPDIEEDTSSELGFLGTIWDWLKQFFTNLYNTLIKALKWFYELWASGMATILDAFAETLVGEGDLDFSKLSVEGALLVDTFPFCIPFDIYDLFTNLVGTSKAPVVDFDFSDTVFGDINGGEFIISIDFGLDYFVLPIKVFRYFVLFGFIYALALKTRDLIRG